VDNSANLNETDLTLCFDEKTGIEKAEVTINDNLYFGESEDIFSALQILRTALEKAKIQLCCNGAALNVYPSAMAFDMGGTRKAYKMVLGVSAKTADLVDIFEYDGTLALSTVDEQTAFQQQWVSSLQKQPPAESTTIRPAWIKSKMKRFIESFGGSKQP
jgi:hypothetical protein